MSPGITVYIADDHTLFRKALAKLMLTFDRISDVRDVENGMQLLELVKVEAPDVAIIDLQMPVMDGVSVCDYLIAKFPTVKIIVLTQHDDHKIIVQMIEKGVHAFILKIADPMELEKAIYAVTDNDFYHNEMVTEILRSSLRGKKAAPPSGFRDADLSEREKEILSLICDELTIREIGDRLSLSENTVRNHRVNMMEKVGVRNTVGLVKYAFDHGLIAEKRPPRH